MNSTEHTANYPAQLRHSTQHPETKFELQSNLIALHNSNLQTESPNLVTFLSDSTIAVVDAGRDNTQHIEHSENIGPVYALDRGGQLAVPTGTIFVRFSDDIAADNQSSNLFSIGFDLKRVPDYAPNAAWIVPTSGSIADALNAIPQLESLVGMVNVEPEMVMETVRR